MVRYNYVDYYYLYNVHGDVVALIDRATGTQVVQYVYDAWGKQMSCTGSLATTLLGGEVMKRIEYFEALSKLFEFKTIADEQGNEFVVSKGSQLDSVKSIEDRTEFEAFENHIHLLNNIKNDEFETLKAVAQNLGPVLLNTLKTHYPGKHFYVYVSIHLHDSMTIRFHQKWDGEEPFCNPDEFTSPKEKVFCFQG